MYNNFLKDKEYQQDTLHPSSQPHLPTQSYNDMVVDTTPTTDIIQREIRTQISQLQTIGAQSKIKLKEMSRQCTNTESDNALYVKCKQQVTRNPNVNIGNEIYLDKLRTIN
jgi:hypothetical protein